MVILQNLLTNFAEYSKILVVVIQLRQVIQAVFESVCDAVAVLAQIAQSVEQRTENPRVTGSIPVLGTVFERRQAV